MYGRDVKRSISLADVTVLEKSKQKRKKINWKGGEGSITKKERKKNGRGKKFYSQHKN